jgi:hypothetical protein
MPAAGCRGTQQWQMAQRLSVPGLGIMQNRGSSSDSDMYTEKLGKFVNLFKL